MLDALAGKKLAFYNDIIVTRTNFSIAIGSLRAYFSGESVRHHMGTNLNIPVPGYLRHSHLNYARFNGFLLNVSHSF